MNQDNNSTNPPQSPAHDSQDPKDAKKKKPKKKGPIRWEAIVPFTIFVALVWAYSFFFFDMHLRRGLEYVGTRANGAEVNIGRLNTSFWNASLQIDRIQITDLDQPQKNKIQIGKIRWKMLWDALLRGKIAINDASILEVAIGAPRERPGRVLPPPPPGSKSAFDKVREAALNKAQEEFSKNILGDVAALLSGVDPSEQLKNIEGQLKSSLRVKELQAELKVKEQEWKQRLDRLPQQKDLKAIETRFKAIKTDRFNGPAEVQASLQELNSLVQEVDAKFKEVQSTGQALGTDTNVYKNALVQLQEMVRQDIKDLENRLKIPKLDVESISKSIFGPLFLDKVKQAEFYMAKARQYMPPKKTPEEKAQFEPPKPHEREVGRNYKFGRPNTYPLFWLHHAEISSKHTPGADWSGNLAGALIDVTDDQPTLGRPTSVTFKGDFPKQEFYGVSGKVTIDHVTENPVESLTIRLASFPVKGQKLVSSPDVSLSFDNAQASALFEGELRKGEISIDLTSAFQKHGAQPNVKAAVDNKPGAAGGTVTADSGPANTLTAPTGTAPAGGAFLLAEAKQPILADILRGAFADIPKVTLNASVAGPWSALRFNINSNLGGELQKAFSKQIDLKVQEARAKLQALVDEQVGKEKAKLEAEFNKLKAQVDGLVKEKEAELNKFKNQIETAKNEAIKNQSKKLEDEGKKALDKLKGKLKF